MQASRPTQSPNLAALMKAAVQEGLAKLLPSFVDAARVVAREVANSAFRAYLQSKKVLAAQDKPLPPSISAEVVNPYIDIEAGVSSEDECEELGNDLEFIAPDDEVNEQGVHPQTDEECWAIFEKHLTTEMSWGECLEKLSRYTGGRFKDADWPDAVAAVFSGDGEEGVAVMNLLAAKAKHLSPLPKESVASSSSSTQHPPRRNWAHVVITSIKNCYVHPQHVADQKLVSETKDNGNSELNGEVGQTMFDVANV
ncbi:hypothetical protein BV22DRAFT_1135055 [Leucogyrophana mollusca]|uniref:Uncharacterized protein n=1 Tax=Leucogyrophana mollusca TaxID=85980 RepID=A0ACB8AWG7_9AGAM|nr:hypothetical protein BV22DRAFT_1135055 [Leucogyrophana mollusca]